MDPNPNEAGPSSPPGDAVLNEVLVNRSALRHVAQTGQPAEDQDLALAKILQEQERAFLALATMQAPVENMPPPPGAAEASDRSPSTDSDRPLTDEELAWKLMQEEEAEFQRRMMALAGVPIPGVDPAQAVVDAEGDGGAMQPEDSDDDIPDPDAMSYEELTALGEVVGTVATGLSQEQIDALPVVKYEEIVATKGGGEGAEEEQCAVCCLEFEKEDSVKKLPCGHYYHPECVGQWLLQKKVCPECKREIKTTATATGANDAPEQPAVAPPAPSLNENENVLASRQNQ